MVLFSFAFLVKMYILARRKISNSKLALTIFLTLLILKKHLIVFCSYLLIFHLKLYIILLKQFKTKFLHLLLHYVLAKNYNLETKTDFVKFDETI